MQRSRAHKIWGKVGPEYRSSNPSVYAALIINSEYMDRAGMKHTGKTPEGNNHG